jgi:hypothetical protein
VSVDAVFGSVPTLQPLRLTQQPPPSQPPPPPAPSSAAAAASTQQGAGGGAAKGRGKGKAKALATAGSTDLGPVGAGTSAGGSTMTGGAAADGQPPEPIVVLAPLIVRVEPPVQPDTPEGTSPAPASTPGGSHRKGRGLVRSKADKAAAAAAAEGGGHVANGTADHHQQQGASNFKRFVKASVVVDGRQVAGKHLIPQVPLIPLQRWACFKCCEAGGIAGRCSLAMTLAHTRNAKLKCTTALQLFQACCVTDAHSPSPRHA